MFKALFGLLLLAKAVDIGGRGSDEIGNAALVTGAVWAVAAISIAVDRWVRVASLVIIVLAVFVAVFSDLAMYNQHLYLLGSICAILAIDVEVEVLLKWQLTIAYVFAAVTKLNEWFLSGSVVYESAVQRPFWHSVIGTEPPVTLVVAVAIGAVLTETFLAFAFWTRLRWIALAVGLGFHGGMLVLMSQDMPSALRLGIFGGLMVCLYLPFFRPELDRAFGRRLGQSRAESATGSHVGATA